VNKSTTRLETELSHGEKNNIRNIRKRDNRVYSRKVSQTNKFLSMRKQIILPLPLPWCQEMRLSTSG